MKWKINIHSAVSVYCQIENLVKFEIASGRMKEGDQLPSIKVLGDELGINFNTVAKAYRDLEVGGYLYTRRGMGCFINRGVQKMAQAWVKEHTTQKIAEAARECFAGGISSTMLKKAISDNYSGAKAVYA